MKKIISLALGLAILSGTVMLASCGTSGGDNGNTGAANGSEEQSDAGSAGDTEGEPGSSKEFPPLYETMKTGIVYSRDDVSDEYWAAGSTFTNEYMTDLRFQEELLRPYTDDAMLLIPQTYSVTIDAAEDFLVTINKDNLFYIKETSNFFDEDRFLLYYLSTTGFYANFDLSLYETDSAQGHSFEETKAIYDREGKKYETKNLNGWDIILQEADISKGLNQGSVPGYTFEFFYTLTEARYINADGGLACDKENAEIFMEKFTNNFSFEKITEDQLFHYAKAENFDRIKLDDKITLKINSPIGFSAVRAELPGPVQPDDYYATQFFFQPQGLAFEGKEVERLWFQEIDKGFKEYLNQDEDLEFAEYEYKGMKLNLIFNKTKDASELNIIEFETDLHIYRVIVGSWGVYATKDQDYEAFVGLVMDNIFELT